MKPGNLAGTLAWLAVTALALPAAAQGAPKLFPAAKAKRANPDTHLTLTFASEPKVGATGFIRIYNTMDMNGRPIDLAQRHPVSIQLTKDKNAETIANYSKPEFVLGAGSR